MFLSDSKTKKAITWSQDRGFLALRKKGKYIKLRLGKNSIQLINIIRLSEIFENLKPNVRTDFVLELNSVFKKFETAENSIGA